MGEIVKTASKSLNKHPPLEICQMSPCLYNSRAEYSRATPTNCGRSGRRRECDSGRIGRTAGTVDRQKSLFLEYS